MNKSNAEKNDRENPGPEDDLDESSGEVMSDESSDDSNEGSNSSSSSHKRLKTGSNVLLDKYEYLKQKIREENFEAHKGNASSLVLQHLKELDEIYEVIQKEKNRNTKVQLIDAETFMDASKFAALNARNMKFLNTGLSLNATEFITNLQKYLKHGQQDGVFPDELLNSSANVLGHEEILFNSFNWMKLGTLFYATSNRRIAQDFLYGPLGVLKRRQATRSRTIDDTKGMASTTAQRIDRLDFAGDQEQTTAQIVKDIYKIFIQKSDNRRVNFFVAFINPHSFAQSVENLFYISFLIKDGRLELTDHEGVPMLQSTQGTHSDGSNGENIKRNAHHIASFDYEAWSYLIEKYDITLSFLSHRNQDEELF